MGLFSKGECALCGAQVRPMTSIKIADGLLCKACYRKTGYSINIVTRDKTIEDIKAAIAEEEEDRAAKRAAFSTNRMVGGYFAVDESKRQWVIPDGFTGKIKNARVYDFDDIVGYELLEDGETLAKGGLGRALVGGALFGGVGAIVGGITGKRSKNVINNMKIKITVRNMSKPVEYISLISSRTKANSLLHRSAREAAQEILSLLELIME